MTRDAMAPSMRSLAALLVLLGSRAAAAQPAPAPSQPAPPPASAAPRPAPPTAPQPTAPQPPPTPVAPFPVDVWLQRYQAARALFFAGEFERASQELLALASLAPDPAGALAARELGVMAAEWHRRGMKLVPASQAAAAAAGGVDRSRRTTDEIASLYATSVFYGLGTGVWLGVVNEPKSAAGAILPALALAGASAGAVAILDRGKGMGYGVPQSIQAGLTLGILEGVTWSVWNQARSRSVDEWSEKTVATVIWGSGTLGAVAGGVAASVVGTTPGRSAFVSSAGLWGGLLSGLVAASLTSEQNEQMRDDNALLAAALGLNAAAIGGALAAGKVSPTIARVRYIDLGGIVGGIVVGGLYIAAKNDNVEGPQLMGLTALGVGAGLGLAYTLTQSMEADRPGHEPPSQVSARLGLAPSQGGMRLGVDGRF